VNEWKNEIQGAEINAFFFEIGRVTEANEVEKTFHIFYYFLHGASKEYLNVTGVSESYSCEGTFSLRQVV
jgi:myosin heavy subunit